MITRCPDPEPTTSPRATSSISSLFTQDHVPLLSRESDPKGTAVTFLSGLWWGRRRSYISHVPSTHGSKTFSQEGTPAPRGAAPKL